jgi:ribosomal protein S27AE
MSIITLETAKETQQFGSHISVQLWCTYLRSRDGLSIPISFVPHGFASAVVNHGRWIVRCPLCTPGAMLASRKEPLFWCPNCGMAANNERPMHVIFPNEADVIDDLLSRRPDPHTRHWEPTESIDMLLHENRANGVI